MDEKKEYVAGTVTISTVEYRDLIEELTKLKAEHAGCWSAKYAVEQQVKKLTDELTELQCQHAKLRNFVNSSEEQKAKYRLYLVEASLPVDTGDV